MSSTALVPASDARAVEPRSFMLPAMTLHEARERFNAMVEFTQDIMTPGKDFGNIPGTEKPTLLKPGAEKLSTFFGLAPRFEIVEKTQDWTGTEHNGEPFFYYMVKCRLFRGERFMGEGDGSCNSWESRYRYRWVAEHEVPPGVDKSKCRRRGGKISEFTFSVEKAETTGKYGKPTDYWQAFKDGIAGGTAKKVQKKTKDGKVFDAWEIDRTFYRVPNSDIADAVNTVLKIACKRALIAAVLITTNASEYYTQDIEDLEVIDVEFSESVRHHPAQPQTPMPSTNSNGNGHKPQKPFEVWVSEVAVAWEKQGYCKAELVSERLKTWGIGHGEQRPLKDWPETLQAKARQFVGKELLAELKQPATEAMHRKINELCDELGWDADERAEYLENAHGLQAGELPQYEHKAQAVIFDLQAKLKEGHNAPSPSTAEEGEEIPF